MTRLRNLYCHGNRTIHFFIIVVVVDVAVNNIKLFNVAM